MINSKTALELFITQNWNIINQYIDQQNKNLPIPLYSSVDLRESPFKYAPVDHNIYPAGFNNICQLDQLIAAEKIQQYLLDKKIPLKGKIAIIPESNTRNGFYLDHLATLKNLIEKSGHEVFIATFDHSLFTETSSLKLTSHSQFPLEIFPLKVNDHGTLFIGDKDHQTFIEIDACIMNNDQSSPFKQDWEAIKTPIFPPAQIGWYQRQKNKHFTYYDQFLTKFCEHFSINKSLMEADFETCENIDFATKEGLEALYEKAVTLFKRLPKESKVFIKASQGTYGMGISVISSPEEILSMNRKTRNKMDIGKNKLKFTSILLQEGVETIVKFEQAPAEVSIYLVNGKSIGGFMRANPLKGVQANLNARGMVYRKFCISEISEGTDYQVKEAIYSVIARLATTASALEIKDVLS